MKEVLITRNDVKNLLKIYDADKIIKEISQNSDEERIEKLFNILVKYKEGNV
jgi:hypothetical protein